MERFVVAAIQMDIAFGNSRQNLEKAGRLINKAAGNRAQVVCLPELFNTGYDYPTITRQADDLFAEGVEQLSQLARKNGLYIITGSMAEQVDDRIYNTCLVIDETGSIKGKYRKIHLFPPLAEPQHFTPGEEPQVVKTPFGEWGLMLCYDLRFASLSIKLGLLGAQIIFIPAQFPNPRLHHWQVLLTARAIETQSYIVGVNRCGSDPQCSYFGNSMVVNPSGKLVASLGQEEGILLADIDLAQNKLVREDIYHLDNSRIIP